jgi:tetratricopeptide (TPR) repeat protein
MQFIDGRPLSDVIREMGQPPTVPAPASPAAGEQTAAYTPANGVGAATESAARQATLPTGGQGRRREYFRKVAELGEQAAEALDHAHQAGIVHRDVKPGNLLLDGAGRLWVTDFGLAHVAQGEASLTATGDLVGTLRYMSPEQALAKRVPIDHRTDVYSLGATLYELLTLRPAFQGTDRQELLRQIAFEEPQAPRRIDKAIPAELDIIVQKALEKNPAERYATAQELADDLRHFLDDKPIQARRPSWRQVAAKWARRHKGVVGATAVVLLVAAVLVGGFGVWRLQQRAAAEAEAKKALEDADRLQREEKWPEALLTIRRAEPLLNTNLLGAELRQRVQERLEDLKMLDRLEQIRLDRAAMKDGHFDDAQSDSAYAKAFRDYGIDVMALSVEEAAARMRVRSIHLELAAALVDWSVWGHHTGTWDKRDTTWEKLLALARATDPDEERNRLLDAFDQGNWQALKELAAPGAADKFPPSSLVLLGQFLGLSGSSDEAVGVLREAQRRHSGNFWLNHFLGKELERLGPAHRGEDVRYYAAAVALRPLSPGAHVNLANSLYRQGQSEEAIDEYREAIYLKRDYAEAHYDLGKALLAKGQLDEAIAEFREAIRLKKDLGVAHDNLGFALREKGQVDEAIAEHREAIRVNKDHAEAHNNLGIALGTKGLLDEAIAEIHEAIRLKKDNPEAHYNLGLTLDKKGKLDEAILEYREAIRLKNDYAEAYNNLGIALGKKGLVDESIVKCREAVRLNRASPIPHLTLGSALGTKGQLDEAIAECREAIRLKQDYAEAHCVLGRILVEKGLLREAVEELRLGHQLGSRNPSWLQPSAQWLRQAEQLVALDVRFSQLLKREVQPTDPGERLRLALLCQQYKQLDAAAVRWYAEAFAADPRIATDLQAGHRYNAACAAALAGCGQGKDASALGDEERARLRMQALCWLREDLQALAKQRKSWWPGEADLARQTLQHWQQDPDLAGVRGPEALAKLPEAERQQWQKLWADVADLLARAQGKSAPEKKSDTKEQSRSPAAPKG